MRERFFEQGKISAREATKRASSDHGIPDPSEWRKALDLETPLAEEDGFEHHVTEKQDMLRIFEFLKKHWDGERKDFDQPFTHTLDRIEVIEALRETRPQTLEEAQKAVAKYHTDWQKIEEITQLSQEVLEEKELADLMTDSQMAREYIKRISYLWNIAFREYWYQKNRKEDRYKYPEDEFGINMYDVDAFLAQPQEAREQLLSKYLELNEIRKRFHVDETPALEDTQRAIQQAIKKIASERPGVLRQFIARMDSSGQPIDDQALDELLGIEIEAAERRTDYEKLHAEYPKEEFWQGGIRWTPYEIVRTMLHELKLNDADVLYDLGSGFGRIPIYASLATGAQCKGIEIVPERVAGSIAAKNNLNVDNLEFIQGNVLEQDYSDGTVFFLFNPFAYQTLEAVNDTLRQLAQTKKIRVVSLGPSTSFFDHQDWLKPTELNEHPWGLTIYESK